jgi:hypothetical protein
VRAGTRITVVGACLVFGAALLGGCAFNLYQQKDCYTEDTVRYRRTGSVTFDDGADHRASGPFVIDDVSPAQNERPQGLGLYVDGFASECSSATFNLYVEMSGSLASASMEFVIPAPGTYSLESLGAVMTTLTSSSADADAGITTRDAHVTGTVTVTSASETGCTAEFNSADQIYQACASTLVLNLTLAPSPEYPVSGTFSIDLLTKLVVIGTTTALSCAD